MVKIVCSACGYLDGPGHTFHRFPKDVRRCNSWAMLVDRYDLLDQPPGVCHANYGLCGVHFRRLDFVDGKLKKNAFPEEYGYRATSSSWSGSRRAAAAPADATLTDANPTDSNPADSNRTDANPADSNPADSNRTDANSTDANPADSNSTESNSTVTNLTVANPTVANPADSNPTDANPADSNPTESNPTVANPADVNPADSNPADAIPADSNPTVVNPTVANPTDVNSTVTNPADSNPTVANPADSNPTVANPTDAKLADADKNAGGTPRLAIRLAAALRAVRAAEARFLADDRGDAAETTAARRGYGKALLAYFTAKKGRPGVQYRNAARAFLASGLITRTAAEYFGLRAGALDDERARGERSRAERKDELLAGLRAALGDDAATREARGALESALSGLRKTEMADASLHATELDEILRAALESRTLEIVAAMTAGPPDATAAAAAAAAPPTRVRKILRRPPPIGLRKVVQQTWL